MSNLAARVLVAVVAIPLIILVAMSGGYLFFGFVGVVATVALIEFYSLARSHGMHPQATVGVVGGACLILLFTHNRLQYTVANLFAGWGMAIPLPTMAQAVMILMLVFMVVVMLVELFRAQPHPLANIASTVVGVLYVSLMLGTLVGLRELFVPGDFPVYRFFEVSGVDVPADVRAMIDRWGGYTMVSILASLWMCDTAAYFVGRKFGKHKLFERVSPNKTWEGALAGLAAAVGTSLLAGSYVLPYLTLWQAIVLGVIVGVFGQLGDLVESLLKRDAGVKDSSTLIPGHGGALDRFDSLIFVSPLVFLYVDYVVF